MPQSAHNPAAETNSLAEHNHATAAASHNKADHLTSHELSKEADERSATKRKHDNEVTAEVAKPDKV
jgi:hypothetical protein